MGQKCLTGDIVACLAVATIIEKINATMFQIMVTVLQYPVLCIFFLDKSK